MTLSAIRFKKPLIFKRWSFFSKYRLSKIGDSSSAAIAETSNLFSHSAEKNRGIKSFENTAQTSSAS
jgi:hypothetical protein